MANFCSGKKCLKNKNVIALLAIIAGVAALWLIWFGTGNFISKQLVEKNLQDFSVQINKFADAHGKTADLTYGEIEISGWGSSKKAIIKNPSLVMSTKGIEGKSWAVSTDKAQVEIDPINPQHLVMSFSDDINLAENAKTTETIAFSEPFTIAYGKLPETSGNSILQHDISLPRQIIISHILPEMATAKNCPEGDEKCANSTENNAIEPAKNQTVISFASVPSIKIISMPDENKKLINYNFSGLEISSADGSKTTIANVSGGFNQQYAGDIGGFSNQYNLELGNIVFSNTAHSSEPYAFNLNVVVDKNPSATAQPSAPKVTETTAEAAQAPTASPVPELPLSAIKKVTINQFAFSGKDFKVNASGDISVDSEDHLPFGLVNLQIDNASQFLNSEVIPVDLRSVTQTILEKMIGQPIEKQENITIPLKREKNGIFYLGQTTFEALASNFLTDVLMSHPAGEPATTNEPQISAPSISMPAETKQQPQAEPISAPVISTPDAGVAK